MIIIANGFNKFHLAPAAAALQRRGALTGFITGAYPYGWIRRSAARVGLKWPRLTKFFDRAETIDETKIRTHFLAEAVYFSHYAVKHRRGFRRIAAWIDRSSYRLCAWASEASVRAFAPHAKIYHYRSGFGLQSAMMARRAGLRLICDHSIVHPRLFNALVHGGGQWPESGAQLTMDSFWAGVDEDIDLADTVLVNSDFVKETFVRIGYPAEKVKVIYLGVDEGFFRQIPDSAERGERRRGRILFAGQFERRKGGEVLLDAMAKGLPSGWSLEIAGKIAPELRERVDDLLKRPEVHWHGAVRRAELARLMTESEIFVFPSLAEGSARVIFEAMACGCAVITTSNSGSIVKPGEHGWLVPPGDAGALNTAIREALADPEGTKAMGRKNAVTVAQQYREVHYGDNLMALYSAELDDGITPSSTSL